MTGEDMGINWVTWFRERHKDKIKTVYLKLLDKNRQLSKKISQYNITPENTYNFDEKGFLLGSCHALKCLVSIKALQAGKSVATQDGSWEFLSLLCSVSADGIALPPALIYQGESRDLQDTWLDDFDGSEYAYFAASVNGWSNDEYGLEWLQRVFNPHTKAKAGRARRLLLLDGHSSHINMKFIEYANRERILLLILPPHSTHRLQPLDVGVFGPLGKAYSSELESLLHRGLGYIRMTKRDFWRLFNAAWKKALMGDNIRAGFAKTGIYSLDPQCQLSRFETADQQGPAPLVEPSIPTNIQELRQEVKGICLRHSLNLQSIGRVIKASKQFAIRNELLEHENRALKLTIVMEKQRRKRGKPLGLLDRDNPSQAQFWSPTKVLQARERRDEIEAEKAHKIAQTQEAKLQWELQREQAAREAEEKRIERETACMKAREQQEAEKLERAIQQEAQRVAREEKKALQQAEKERQAVERASKHRQSELQAPASKRRRQGLPTKEPHRGKPIQSSQSSSKSFTSLPNKPLGSLAEKSTADIPLQSFLSTPRISRSGRNIRPSTRLFS
ncbi:mariner-Tc1 transposon family protein [Coccidioides posadasii C735 delta SOWgp]|uniref:Mariner-Tc1 transposon family protein n=1 Tax=Coccidioides posadasii (strain C735) TaxID=222929 RepID=C5P495_COCP7|nr:mariner-Tc1 transposon family protein [Coccidioides posadasii C735 delta SOWgp]EER28513.1 mariner-Tc1 transposon family protein [Coccidioides posadasii C735 delta SOWgp]|eukprot:XP_003070658.1 mariner-Tc1 transposon family protein [Coccidioides posadasii C735 delta SOWgp]